MCTKRDLAAKVKSYKLIVNKTKNKYFKNDSLSCIRSSCRQLFFIGNDLKIIYNCIENNIYKSAIEIKNILTEKS